MEGGAGGEFLYGAAEEEGCVTPRHEGCRIPAMPAVCPPAPRRKGVLQIQRKKKRNVAKEMRFPHAQDIELFFQMMSLAK